MSPVRRINELLVMDSDLVQLGCRLDEVIQLWDFLLAYGVHLNILVVIAQLFNMRTEIMESPSFVTAPAEPASFCPTLTRDSRRPMQLFRKFPPLQAKKLIGISVVLVNDLPEDLYAELVKHPRRGSED